MATFEEPLEEDTEFSEVEELGKVEEEPQAVEEPTVEEKPKEELPEKYRGKSLEDVAKMHQELESSTVDKLKKLAKLEN